MMFDSAYYWAVIGRYSFDEVNTVFVTDLPATQAEAHEEFLEYMYKKDPNAYYRKGVLVCNLLCSTEPIEIVQ